MMHPKKRIFLLASFLMICSCVFCIAIFYMPYSQDDALRESFANQSIDNRLKDTFDSMNNFPGSAGKDLLFLSQLSSVRTYADFPSESAMASTQKDFQNFISKNYVYYKLYLFGADGQCLGMAWNNKVDTDAQCQQAKKSLGGDLKKISPLGSNDIYTSQIKMYQNIPAIVYGTHIFSGGAGADVVAVVSANYFLEDIRQLARSGETVFLLNKNGQYLANPDRSKEEFSGGTANFYQDFPQLLGGILQNNNAKRFETAQRIFTFWRIYPTEDNFTVYKNDTQNTAMPDNYYLILAGVSDKPANNAWWSHTSFIILAVVIILLHALAISLLYFAMFHFSKSNKNI